MEGLGREREGWAMEDAVMRQRGTEVDGEKHVEREYDDIPREERLIELVSLPPSALSLPSPPPTLSRLYMYSKYSIQTDTCWSILLARVGLSVIHYTTKNMWTPKYYSYA